MFEELYKVWAETKGGKEADPNAFFDYLERTNQLDVLKGKEEETLSWLIEHRHSLKNFTKLFAQTVKDHFSEALRYYRTEAIFSEYVFAEYIPEAILEHADELIECSKSPLVFLDAEALLEKATSKILERDYTLDSNKQTLIKLLQTLTTKDFGRVIKVGKYAFLISFDPGKEE